MKDLDRFGTLVMEKLRDESISFVEGLLEQHWKAPKLKKLQRDVNKLEPKEREIVLRAARAAIDTGIHSFLFALQEAMENGQMAVLVNGKSIAEQTDGLHGELFTPTGWQARFSQYGEAPEVA